VLREARALERNYRCSCPCPSSWHRQVRSRGTGVRFPLFLPFVDFLGRVYSFLGQAWAEGKRRACNEPPLRGLQTGRPGKMYAAMICIGQM